MSNVVSSETTPKGTSGFITLKYAGAVLSVLVAVGSVTSLVGSLFSMWTSGPSSMSVTSLLVGGGLGYAGAITTAVTAVLFSVIAFMLYRHVTKDIAAEPQYVKTHAYSFITNALVAVLAFAFVSYLASVVSVLLSSLMLIGTNVNIGDMYLNQFLPSLLSAGLVAFVGLMAYKIVKGKNMSSLMTIVLMSTAGALFLAAAITVPIKAHATTSPNMTTDYSKYIEDYLKN